MTRTIEDVERELVAATADMHRAIARFEAAETLSFQGLIARSIAVHAARVEALAFEAHDMRVSS